MHKAWAQQFHTSTQACVGLTTFLQPCATVASRLEMWAARSLQSHRAAWLAVPLAMFVSSSSPPMRFLPSRSWGHCRSASASSAASSSSSPGPAPPGGGGLVPPHAPPPLARPAGSGGIVPPAAPPPPRPPSVPKVHRVRSITKGEGGCGAAWLQACAHGMTPRVRGREEG